MGSRTYGESFTGRLRFVERYETVGDNNCSRMILQQEVATTEYAYDVPMESRTEWRDVPVGSDE